MDPVSLILTFLGTAAGLVGTVYGVRQFYRPAPVPPPPLPAPHPPPGDDDAGRDVFVSYAPDDREWTRALAVRLEAAGLSVWLDEWEIGPSDVVLDRIEQGIGGARNAVMVLSPHAVASPRVRQEYAALMTRSIERGLRFIPLLYGTCDVPEFLGTRRWIDFRDPGAFTERFDLLVRTLRGERPVRA
ncbi:toll/interleukin-1 receptor domain-containing protein [Actinomadura rayongensis]|uniref:TIR domain-containing protein n=1 Tax=Actinomadura rayongensis TaxID=1429076 RepID=A0A6I4W318_9ACTN|nr:toll/interleukin-1 receptor domain-containing protein [Actinomadura rayongensis]MXQ65039.1 TIR domain-containing protein [Actinomadura rayongensis]